MMVDFGEYKKPPWFFALFCGQPAAFPAFPTSLVFSVFGQFCVSESLEIHARKLLRFEQSPPSTSLRL